MNTDAHHIRLFGHSARLNSVLLSLTLAVTTLHAADTKLHYLAAGQPDAATLLAPPPRLDSPEQAADLTAVSNAFHSAGSNEIAAAYSEKFFSVFNFAPAVGAFFQSNNLPKTAAFFEKVQRDAEMVTDTGKEHFKRPRPFVADPSLANGSKLEKSFSYPSGHSTETMVLGLVLADLLPEQHEAILAHARTMGWHRVQIARHYPTDIHAGRVLAQAIVRQFKTGKAFKKDLATVQAELAAVQAASKN